MKSIVIVAALLLAARPAAAQIRVVGRAVHETVARAGDRYRGLITVTNPGTDSIDVRLRLADYRIEPDGRLILEPAGLGGRSNALWIVLGARQVTIAPGDSLDIPYGVRVPPVAPDSLGGSYRSVIVVDPGTPGTVEVITHVGTPSRRRIAGGSRGNSR